MDRLAELVEHVVRGIHDVADGSYTDGLESADEPLRARTDLHAPEHRAHVPARPCIGVDAHLDAGGASRALCSFRLRNLGSEIGNLGQMPLRAGDCRQLAGQPEVGQQIRPVRGDVEHETRVSERHGREKRRSGSGIHAQLENALMVVAKSELARGTEHAIRDHAANLATLDLHSVRQRCADRRERIQFSGGDIRRAANHFDQLSAAGVHFRHPEMIRIRMSYGFGDARDDDRSEIRP